LATGERGPIRLGEALQEFLKRQGLRGRLRILEVCRAWHETVGEEVSRDTRVGGFRRGVLVVEVDSSTRFYELSQFYKEEILEKLRARLPGEYLNDIRFRLVR